MSRSVSIFRAKALVMIALVTLSTVGCERTKTRLDREVDRLCAIDGGVHIYETVKLSKENFGPDGEVFPQFKGRTSEQGRYGSDYWGSLEVAVLIAGNPSLQRNRVAMRRRSDDKVLAEIIDYKRGGGDLPGPWEPSYYTCPQSIQTGDFYRRVFLPKGE